MGHLPTAEPRKSRSRDARRKENGKLLTIGASVRRINITLPLGVECPSCPRPLPYTHALFMEGSDIGRRRSVNEDAYLCDDELGLWVVADGDGADTLRGEGREPRVESTPSTAWSKRGKNHDSTSVASFSEEKGARAACRAA